MTEKRPYLILGDDLKSFVQNRRKVARTPLAEDELFCMACKAPRKPWGLMADYRTQTAKTARLTGLCEACGGTCNRIVSQAKLDRFGEIFALACRDGHEA
ncbi:hypothetical protein C7T35_42035 [Variovorax sp. WS11]|nr:hypothetical protein C7T35_42035 [Variovorax sp. WS11]